MTGRLAHENDFLDQYVEDPRPPGKRDAQMAATVSEMTRRGAPSTCHVVPEDSGVDGQDPTLPDAVNALPGRSVALLIRVPGKLAFHLPEPP